MLVSDRLRLRPVQQSDLDDLYAKWNDLSFRGAYFPLGLLAESTFRGKFEEDGFWTENEGMLVMVDADGAVVGEIEFFPIASYLTGYELSYLVFGDAYRGKGYAPEAVRLLSEYLFARKPIQRLQLNIHPDNHASQRVATKSGYTREGLMRKCWFSAGAFHDLEIWSLLRDTAPSDGIASGTSSP